MTDKKTSRRTHPDRFYPGKVIGPMTITALAVDHPWLSERAYWVRYACCGMEAIRAYRTLAVWDLGDRVPGHCAACDEKLRGGRARLEARHPPGGADHSNYAEPRAQIPSALPMNSNHAWV